MPVTTKTLHGARAVLTFVPNTDPNGKAEELGVFESVDSGSGYEHFEPYVLGRVSAGEVVLTAMMPVSVRLGGFRKLDEGPFSPKINMLKLQRFYDDDQEFTIVLTDKVSDKPIMTIMGCKIINQNFSVAARNPARLNLEVVGLVFRDENSPDQSEPGVAY